MVPRPVGTCMYAYEIQGWPTLHPASSRVNPVAEDSPETASSHGLTCGQSGLHKWGGYLNLARVKQKAMHPPIITSGQCAGPPLCPLSQVQLGAVVCIKALATSPELKGRLREMGFHEEQQVRLLSKDANYICQICNARLGISGKIAASIMVQAIPERNAAIT